MTPPTSARRRALRAVLSALAGGGLTAAGLGGPLAVGAHAASFSNVPTTPEVSAESGETTTTDTTATSTTPTTTSTTPTTTTTTPTTTSTTTSTEPTTTPASTPQAPTVALQRRQKSSSGATQSAAATTTTAKKSKQGESNVAGSPQSVAKAGALAAILASSQASVQSLSFYRVPLFLLPIYKAAAVQYGVPWQILAAINEVETDYGADQSVSSAGAVGWMQFMPETWLQYGVDALEAGYADPYNPVDAIFAAARYLRAAGAATNLRRAILAYNHSEEYAESVLLRAKLIATYPKAVIATLTGLVDGRPPVDASLLEWSGVSGQTASSGSSDEASASSATAKADATASTRSSATPGSTAAPSPTAAASSLGKTASPIQLVNLTSSAKANVVAVEDGRIVGLGDSRKLGRYVILRDVYGDLFTYAGLGSIAPTYKVASESASGSSPVVKAASTHDPAPSQPATAGTQTPVTLQVKAPALQSPGAAGGKVTLLSTEAIPAGMGRKRLFARPDNPDARAAEAVVAQRRANRARAGERVPLRKGSVVTAGTILGKVSVVRGSSAGHLRFAIRPAGDSGYIDPGPVLANWAELQKALHPQGAKATDALLGATASDVFLLSKAQLERTVLSDPGITMQACERQQVASGDIDRRVLAVLAFMSRSGLKPTVSALRCGQSQYTASGALSAQYRGDAVDISAINGVSLAGHQGPGTIADLTIRTLLTLPSEFVPHEILSLMHYPASAGTRAERSYWNRIGLAFQPASASASLSRAATSAAAHSAGKGKTAPAPVVSTTLLSTTQWTQLINRIAAIASPKIATKPTSSAIPDRKRR